MSIQLGAPYDKGALEGIALGVLKSQLASRSVKPGDDFTQMSSEVASAVKAAIVQKIDSAKKKVIVQSVVSENSGGGLMFASKSTFQKDKDITFSCSVVGKTVRVVAAVWVVSK